MRGLLAVLAVVIAVATPTAAGAVPTTGPSPDTPGTTATVSPRSLSAGGTVSFRISGFPGGEVVYVKIDDGRFCSESGVHGACVVHQQRIPASGTVTGSLVLPSDLGTGKHWLRFLASKEMYGDDGTYQGIEGYTLRGDSDFTVTATDPTSSPSAPSVSAGPGTTATTMPTATAPAAPSASATPSTGIAAAGATIAVAPTAPPPTDETPTATGEPEPTTAGPAPVPAAAGADSFPVVGAAGLALMCALAGALVIWARRSRA